MRTLVDLHKENAKIIDTLAEELVFVTELAKGEQPSLRYRVFIRSAFSHLEAMTWIMKQTALAYAESPTPEQVLFANEVSYRLDDNGDTQETRAKTPFAQNLQFAFRFASEVFGAEFELDRRCPHWGYMIEAVRLRDAITHPKTLGALEVTQDQFSRAVDGLIWVMQRMQAVMQAMQQHSERITRPMTEIARATIESARSEMIAHGGQGAEQVFRRAEAIANQIQAESEGGNIGEHTLERMYEEVSKKANEHPEWGAFITPQTVDDLKSKMMAISDQNPMLTRVTGIDPQALMAKVEEMTKAREGKGNPQDCSSGDGCQAITEAPPLPSPDS